MLNPEITFLRVEELKGARQFLSHYEFNDYRNYPLFTKTMLDDYLFTQVSDLLLKDKHSYIAVAKNKKKIVGLVSLVKLPWETRYFGFKMAEIRHLIANGSYDEKIRINDALLWFISQICKKEKVMHLSCKVDAEDFSGIHCLERTGFRLMGSAVTYVFEKGRIPKFKERCTVRMFKKKDMKAAINLLKTTAIKGRFQIDPYIPKQKANEFYVEWIRNCSRRLWADEVLVAERGKEIVGFLAYQLNKELEKATGIRCFRANFAVVSPRGVGSFIALLKVATVRGRDVLRADLAEFETQVYNYSIIRVFQRLKIGIGRCRYSFHKCFGKGR